jgi:hypothetical protein
MVLDPQARALLDQFARAGVKPLSELSIQEARDQMEMGSCFLGRGDAVHAVEDFRLQEPVVRYPSGCTVHRPAAGCLAWCICTVGAG